MPRMTAAAQAQKYAPYGALHLAGEESFTAIINGSLTGKDAVRALLKEADMTPAQVKKRMKTTGIELEQILPTSADVFEPVDHAGEHFLIAGDAGTSIVLYVSNA